MVKAITEIPSERIERRNSTKNMAKCLYGSNDLINHVNLTRVIDIIVDCESSRQPVEKQLIRSCFPPDAMILHQWTL